MALPKWNPPNGGYSGRDHRPTGGAALVRSSSPKGKAVVPWHPSSTHVADRCLRQSGTCIKGWVLAMLRAVPLRVAPLPLRALDAEPCQPPRWHQRQRLRRERHSKPHPSPRKPRFPKKTSVGNRILSSRSLIRFDKSLWSNKGFGPTCHDLHRRWVSRTAVKARLAQRPTTGRRALCWEYLPIAKMATLGIY